jgi:death-on-curing protein
MEPVFLTLDEVLELHQQSIEEFGGSPEVRDFGLLNSAIQMPQAAFGGAFLHPTLPEMAAAYLFHLVQNHPFVDGNKRIGALAARVFLLTNDVAFDPSEEAYFDLVISVATGKTGKPEASEFFRRHTKSA